METPKYRNIYPGARKGESRDSFDSRVRKQYENSKKKTGTEKTSVPVTNTGKQNATPVEPAKKPESRDNRIRRLYGRDYEYSLLTTRQEKENKQRTEAKTNGEKYAPETFIMGDWYQRTLDSTKFWIHELEGDVKTAGESLVRLEANAKYAEQRYAETGLERDKIRAEGARRVYTKQKTVYDKKHEQYNTEIERYNRTLGEFQTYSQKESAVYEEWQKTVRQDPAVIQKEIEEAKRKIAPLEEKLNGGLKGMYDAAMTRKYWEAEGKTYEEWVEHGKYLEEHPEETDWADDYDASARHGYLYMKTRENLTREQQRLENLKTEYVVSYMARPDFAEKSKYDSAPSGKEPKYTVNNRSYGGYEWTEIRYEETGYEDILYEYINKNPDAIYIIQVEDSGLNRLAGMDREYLENLSGQEISIFNYIYTENKEDAYEWVKSLESNLKARQRIKDQEQWAEYAKKDKIGSSVFSALLSPAQILPTVMQVGDYIDDGKIDENDGYNRLANVKMDIRQAVSEDMGGFAKWLYNTGMSGADSFINMAAAGFYTPVQAIYSFGNVAASTVIEGKRAGLSDGQAMAKGWIVGAIEAVTEKMGTDELLKVNDANTWGQYIRRVAVANGIEEGAANLGEFAADIVIAKEKSGFYRSLQQYKADGLNDGAAFAKAIGDQLTSTVLDSLGGMLIGGIMAVGSAGINAGAKAIQSGIENRRTLTDAVTGQYEAQKIARENAEGKKIVPMAAQNTAEGFVLPTAKETMAGQRSGANANATSMDAMTDAEYDAQMDALDAEASMAGQSMLYDDGRQYALVGKTADGTEVYETSDKTKKLSYKERMAEFKRIVTEEYRGRTAKFVKNGEVLYARFTPGDVKKSIYGDTVSSPEGWKAKVNVGAEGNVFELVENARFDREQAEKGKNGRMHNKVETWSYFVKTVQIDNAVFDVLANVRERGDGEYVYSITLQNNNEKTPAPPLTQYRASTNDGGRVESGVPTSVDNSIPQTVPFSQENSAQNPSEGNVLPTAKELDGQRRAAKAETETERTGILLGVPQERINTAKRLSKIIGKEVVFYRKTGGKVKNDLGFYDHKTGKIYINADAKDPVAIILGHEMIHDIQLTDGYISFFKTVLRKMQADGINLSEARAELKARYAENGVDLDTTAKIDQDLVAEYAQKHLFTDEASIASVVNADKESGHKILNFLDRILAKLGNKDAQERAFVQKARALYAKALRESREMQSTGWYQNEATAAKPVTETKTASETMADARRETAADLRSTAEPMAGQNEARTMDTMTDEEYDARLDMEEAEASMAGQSMLYDDGRQFMIGDEENVAENKRPWYNESDERTGGEDYGREVGQNNLRRRSRGKDPGEQDTASTGNGRTTKANGKETGVGLYAGRSGENIYGTDSEGRGLTAEFSKRVSNTAIVDKNGKPIATYHFTPNMDFETFAKGDTGFHFGNKPQAQKRAADIGAKKGRIFRAYLNIKNPIRTRLDINAWVPSHTGLYLWSEGYLTDAEWNEVRSLPGSDYNSEAAVRLRNILEQKGYDGIVYPNGVEGEGDSYLVFYDEQIIKTDIENVDTESSDESSTDGRQYAIAKEDAKISPRETSAVEEPETMESIAKTYGEVKRTRRNLEKVNRRMRLSDEDKMQVGRLLRGEILPEHLPEGSDTEGILAVYEAKREYEGYAKRIRAYNQRRKDGLRAKAQEYLGNIQKWKDKTIFGGLRYSTETMERNFQDVMGEDADALISEYLKPVHKATASSTALKNEMRGRVEELNLSRKVEKGNTASEAHAVQLLGEAEDHIAVLKVMGPDATRDGKTLSEWQTILGKLWKENPNLDEGKIRRAVTEFRGIYDELFEMMNDTRVRNGYEPVNYRSGYFPHFQPGDEGVLAQFGRALGIDTAVSALPTTINGMTHIFRPGIQWLGNAQERIGFNTVYDAVEGFDKYIEGVADVIYMTDSIQKLRALAREIRYEASDEGIKKQVDKIEASEELTREEKDALVQSLYEKGKFALGNFVVELDEYTNLLANKKSRGDREMERKLGREWYNIMRRVNSNVAANMTALNIPSWLTNFIPLTQAWGLTDSRYILRGMTETIKAYKNGDDFVSRSTFLTNRRGSDPIIKAWEQGEEAKTIFGKAWRGYQAGIDKLSGGMEFIDQFTADSIVRAKYYQNIDAGMSEEAAMDDADAFAAGVMADRSKGGMPTIFHETNPIKKLFTQFQIEVNNQYRYLFKDVPREMRGKGAAAMAAAFLKVFLGAWMFNELYELLFGRRAAFDPVGIIKEVTENAKGENGLWNGTVSLAKNVSEELPFIGGLLGGGRVPISSALPDAKNLGRAFFDTSWDGKKRLATGVKELGKPAYYMVLPGGGGQIKKVIEGVDATVRGGSYTVDADGNEVLQYPIYNDTPAEAIGNGLRATLFGKSTLPTAKDWVDGGFKGLNAKDTEIYRTLLGAGVQGKEAFPAVQAVRDAKGSNDKRDAIRASGLPEEAKKILYRSKVSDKWDEGIATLEGVGITFDEFLQIQNQYTSAGEAKDDDEATAVTFARWLNTTPYSEEQKAVIKETFRASAGNYDKFVAAGLNDEKAAKLMARLEGLKPEEGKEKVSNVQKYKAIVTAGLPEKEQMAALSAVMSEGEYAKLAVGHTYSVTPAMYVTFKERLGDYDEDGNGSMNQKEVTNAIRNISGGMNLPRHDGTSFNLTNKQKAVLWQLANKSWKARNNPFDTSVGLQVYNALHAE